ncbi:MAG: hypothetical protein JSU96_00795 [Acidobacteriota bacterium]|nr:MAG: hypothetical protein JSU96_00795 [Acidobacteriota bacterium]
MATTLSEPVGLIDCKTAALVPLTGVEVDAEIAGRSSRVKISQKFCNREKVPVEAVYKFPLTEAASICGFRARVGEKVIEGNIEEREKAFEKYDEALEAGHGGYLLDEERPNIFTLSVGNLNPGAEAVLEIEYVTLLETHGREVRFSLPTTISPRYLPADAPDEDGIPAAAKVNPEFELDVPYGLRVQLRVHGRDGIESVESPSHSIKQSFGEDTLEIGLTAEEGKLDRDFVVNVHYREAFQNRA